MAGMVGRGRSSSEIIAQLNVTNAKLLAIVIVFALLGYHGFLKFLNGTDSCQWLQTKGQYRGNHVWQPYGCMIHKYSQSDASRCFKHASYVVGDVSYVAFIGDSRIRQLFFQFLKEVDPEAKPSILDSDYSNQEFGEEIEVEASKAEDTRPLEKAHKSLTYNSTKLAFQVDFFWMPVVNESTVDIIHSLARDQKKNAIPKMVVAGGGVWNIKLSNGSEDALADYVANLSLFARAASRHWPDNGSKLLWKLQDPVDEKKLSPSRKMITNELIDSYNLAATKVLETSRFRIWYSARLLTENVATADDGLHLGPVPLTHHIQVLLNMYCNEWVDFDDATCCRQTEPITTLQLVTLTVLLLCVMFTVAGFVFHELRSRRIKKTVERIELELDEEEQPKAVLIDAVKSDQHSNGHVVGNGIIKSERTSVNRPSGSASSWQLTVISLGKLGLIMAYFFICDRTSIFMKENKIYSTLGFWLPIGYIFVLGLFFNEESRSVKVLHRDQTDEWKGWMQLVILVYHMTGASQIIPLYMQMRLLVSAYLFLTGYGHFCFFWNGGSASFPRLCQVLFRMNMMTVVMCLVMNRPYQSYYFVPLVTFWYLVVYVVLALPPKVNAKICEAKSVAYLYIIIKFIGLFAAITILSLSEVFFEQIFLFRPWKALFVTKDDEIYEWWFRWSLDRYSICYGMVFGFLYVNAQKYGLIDDSTGHNLFTSTKAMVMAVLVGLLGLGGYTAFTTTCRSKPPCNEIHSYVVFVPIFCFILLRNIFGPFRRRYSSLFAWFGRISLELFIGQYHTWLAADTHGVLVLIPNYPVLNVCVTTYILVCLAHEVHTITGQLVTVAVPADWKLALRNFVVFLLALVPIAIHDGMF